VSLPGIAAQADCCRCADADALVPETDEVVRSAVER